MKLYNYAGYASQALADEYGRINREVAALNEKLKAVKEEMVFRDLDEAIGDAYQVTIKHQVSAVLDTDKVKEFLGHRIQAFMTERKQTVVRCKVRSDAKVEAA